MDKTTTPTKEQVRDWIEHRHADHRPLPDLKQIRRELGWDLHKQLKQIR
ncbi:MAG: hypothetical protein JO269_01880 [Burkholderiaceae bacterium]|nr:hypothetical protein [Burkholderiaceae bacterium]